MIPATGPSSVVLKLVFREASGENNPRNMVQVSKPDTSITHLKFFRKNCMAVSFIRCLHAVSMLQNIIWKSIKTYDGDANRLFFQCETVACPERSRRVFYVPMW
jgi:hypothetical protein